MIVADTNLICYLSIPSEMSELAQQALRKDTWCAPILWRSEFRNVLVTYMRRRILTLDDGLRLLASAEKLMWGREYSVRSQVLLEYAACSKRTAYDSEFLVLADDLGIPFVTTDDAIVQEFPETAIHLKNFVRP